MEKHHLSGLIRYGISVVAIGVALGLKLLLIPLMSQDSPFVLFSLAVLIAALCGGLGPGLLATGLAALSNFYFFMEPFNRFAFASPDQPPRLALFVLESVCISVICDRLLVARRRVLERSREAEILQRRIVEIGDAEQRRIGHDLHDGLGQQLTGITLIAKRLEQRLIADDSPRAQDASDVHELAKSAVEWTHDLCRSLSPPALEREGLVAALRALAANIETFFEVDCRIDRDQELVLRDSTAAVHLFRIAQEAISNAIRHGKARHVDVRLSTEDDGRLLMAVIDDGVGIAHNVDDADGMGLRIMQYRANTIGATLEIHRNNGAGTSVICRYAAAGGASSQEAFSGSNNE